MVFFTRIERVNYNKKHNEPERRGKMQRKLLGIEIEAGKSLTCLRTISFAWHKVPFAEMTAFLQVIAQWSSVAAKRI